MQEIAAREGYGRLFSTFGTVAEGLYACDAVDSLVDASAIDTLLSNFIVPLQSDDISKPDAAGAWAWSREKGAGMAVKLWLASCPGGSRQRGAVPWTGGAPCGRTGQGSGLLLRGSAGL